MKVKILVDMNLSPDWVEVLESNNISARHWSTVGDHRAKDRVIMEWARKNGHIVFTHDLDFGTLLALTQATSPSVIQIRTKNVLPEYLSRLVVSVIKQHEKELQRGALIILDDVINRIRILPLI